MKRHTEYKDSGITWIGQIPNEWEIKKFKYICSMYTGNSLNDSEKNYYATVEEGYKYISTKDIDAVSKTINYDTEFTIPFDATTFKIAPENSSVLCIEGGSAGKKIAYNTKDVAFVNKLCCIVTKKGVLSKYVYYLCNSNAFVEPFNLSMTGLIGGVSVSAINNFYAIIPPLETQRAIVDYLDHKIIVINVLIENKQKLIETLKEKRQTIINESVTKGINKTAGMKKSNVEWIGDIPSHWNVKKLRYIGSCQNGLSKAGEFFGYGYPFVSYGDVYKNIELPQNVEGLVESSDTERRNYSVERGDIFFTRTSETIEEVALASTCLYTIKNATFAGFLIRFRPSTQEIIPEFSKYYFRCQLHRAYFVKEMNLVTRASLSQELLKNLPILIPPIDEQKEIGAYLDRKTTAIDSIISNITEQIEKLKEYRQSIIGEAVTGKVAI